MTATATSSSRRPRGARRPSAARPAPTQNKIEAGFPDHVTPELAAFIAEQDTAFLGTASADGAPYIQHRGGPKGFIKVVDEHTLGFADYRGNRQYITLGNLSENDRAYLFLIDFSRRQRIKLWGRARVVENDDALIEKLFDQGYKARPERVILFTIEAWDVNCSQHITARLSEAEVKTSRPRAGADRGAAGRERPPAGAFWPSRRREPFLNPVSAADEAASDRLNLFAPSARLTLEGERSAVPGRQGSEASRARRGLP